MKKFEDEKFYDLVDENKINDIICQCDAAIAP
jgi:hypothetical protein